MEQPLYNLFHRSRVEREYLPLYPELGLTVYSPLAEGILAGRYAVAVPSDSRGAQRSALLERQTQIAAAERLRPMALELNCTVAQLSLAWTLRNGHVSSAIMGASKLSQLEENLGALECLERFQVDTAERMQPLGSEVSSPFSVIDMEFTADLWLRLKRLKARSTV